MHVAWRYQNLRAACPTTWSWVIVLPPLPIFQCTHSIHTFIQIQLTHTQLSLQLRLPDAGQYKNRKITRQMYFAARNHAAAYGPGRPAFHIEHTRKVSISSHSLDLALQWIMDSNNIQKVCERVTVQLTSRLMHACHLIYYSMCSCVVGLRHSRLSTQWWHKAHSSASGKAGS